MGSRLWWVEVLKAWLEDSFDHKLCIDKDDPMKDELLLLESKGLAEIRQFDGVGAEKFAEHAWAFADQLIRDKTDNRCWCESCECAEHGANSAIPSPHKTLYKRDTLWRRLINLSIQKNNGELLENSDANRKP